MIYNNDLRIFSFYYWKFNKKFTNCFHVYSKTYEKFRVDSLNQSKVI